MTVMKKFKNFEDATVKNIKKEIVYWETDGGREAKTVVVLSFGQDPDDDMYMNDINNGWYEQFTATVIIDGETFDKLYEWDCQKGCIVTSMMA